MNIILDKRNKLYHGGYNTKEVDEGKFIAKSEIGELASYAWRSIVGYIILFLREYNHKKVVLNKIQLLIMGKESSDEFQRSIDADLYIQENIPF